MLTREQTQKLAEKVLSYSRLPECDVWMSESENANIRFANNSITTAGFTVERTVMVTTTQDGRTGTTLTTQVDDASLEAVVRRSEELAAIAVPDQEHMPPLGPQEYPETGAYDEQTARARSPEMVPLIASIIDIARKNKLVAAGFFERTAAVVAIANKNKLLGFSRRGDASLSTTVRTPEGTSSGWAAQPSVHIAEIDGVALGQRAVEKCLRWRAPERLEPGRYTVVLEPEAVANLVSSVGWALYARAAEEGRSFLSKKGGGTYLGEKMFPEFITLHSDPFDKRLPADPWSYEYLPNRPVVWIDKGVVQNLFYSRYWASQSKKEPSSRSGLVMEGGEASLEDLIRSTARGLVVTRFWYIRTVNPQTQQLTGLTRDGLFLIENGKVTRPVMNLRFNESPVRMLQNTKQLGRTARVLGSEGASMVAPPLVASDFTFTSVSDAV